MAVAQSPPNVRAARDLAWGLVLFGVSVLYLSTRPRNLGITDESLYLYEAKRILDGAVFYRDVFDIITPGSQYLMAFLFWLFGTDMATARIGMAVLHGLIALAIYATCRATGVRPGLSAAAALTQLALYEPAWPFASPHWVNTFLAMLLLLVLIVSARATRPSAAFGPGIVCGLMIAVQQQRGLTATAGTGTILLVDHLVRRTGGAAAARAALVRRLLAFGAGLVAVVAPLLLALSAAAGPDAVVQALVLQPFVNYRSINHAPWGHVSVLTAPLAAATFPTALAFLPLATILTAIHTAWEWRRGTRPDRLRVLLTLTLFSLFAMASVLYYPDFIHLAFIGAIFSVLLADVLEWGVMSLQPDAVRTGARSALTTALLLALGVRLANNLARHRVTYALSHQTAFGRVEFRSKKQIALVERVRTLLARAQSRELFCYPAYPSLYLLTGADNPTPYQLLFPRYSPQAQLEQTIAILEARRVPVVVLVPLWVAADDPVVTYLKRHYEPVDDDGDDDLPGVVLVRRPDEDAPR